MNTEATVLVQSVGWGLLHSLWQGLLIYCCLRVVLKLSGDVSARVKYHLSMGALAGSFVWFVNTCYMQWQRLQGVTIQVTQSGADPAATKTYALTTLPSSGYNSELLNSVVAGIEPYFPVLVGLYITGIAFLLFRLIINLIQIKALRSKGTSQVEKQWDEWLQQWQEKLDISRKVRLYFSERVSVPMTVGALKPVILLPVACMSNLGTDQLEAILVHELAHIKRHDYLLNILQTIAETVLFFNPFTWLISRIIRKEREHCCDDVVVNYLERPLPYAKALATLETYKLHNNVALAATGNKHQLLNRIKRIMEMKKKPTNYTQVGIAAIAITALILSVAWFSPIIAQTKKVVKKTNKGTTTTTTTVTTGSKKNGNANVITKTIVIDSDKPNKDGVHPKDVGNDEHVKKIMKETMDGLDWEEIGNGVNIAIAGVDWDKMGKDVAIAVNGVDWDKIGKEVSVALNGVNWEELKDELKNVSIDIKAVDDGEIHKAMAEARAKMNDPKFKKQIMIEMQHAKDAQATAMIDMRKAKRDMDEAKDEMETNVRIMHGKHGGKAMFVSANSTDYSEMLDDMESEGLIDRSKKFTVNSSGDGLYINGKKQTASVVKKYKNYLGDGASVNISGSKGNLSISVNK